MKKTMLLILLIPTISGCAHLAQSIQTADGDKYTSKGMSLFSKQEVQAKGNLVIYPNNSGLEFTVGNSGKQDATDAIAFLQSLVSLGNALISAGVLTPKVDSTPTASPTLTVPTPALPSFTLPQLQIRK